ncbi:MAG: hypothetical protein ACC660_02630, partial [Acidimicrobiales bacterium]
LLAISLLFVGTVGSPIPGASSTAPAVIAAPEMQPPTSLNPVIEFSGGSPAARRTVVDAVARYGSVGLALPDLEVNIHPERSGCGGSHGLFNEVDGIGVIDLCFDREMLALHELGHAWARFNLDDQDRADFTDFAGLPAWTGRELVWSKRGTEAAAQALAHGLLSLPLRSGGERSMQLARFEALTGTPSPRLAEIETPATQPVSMTAEERVQAAAYAAWRQTAEDPAAEDPAIGA